MHFGNRFFVLLNCVHSGSSTGYHTNNVVERVGTPGGYVPPRTHPRTHPSAAVLPKFSAQWVGGYALFTYQLAHAHLGLRVVATTFSSLPVTVLMKWPPRVHHVFRLADTYSISGQKT